MISKARATHVRISSRKANDVMRLIRRKHVVEAYSILDRTPKKASVMLKKLIQSATDAAIKQKNQNVEALVISKLTADGAGMLKRWRSMSMGKAGMIRKRLSHLSIELDIAKKPYASKAALPEPSEQKLAGAK